MNFIQEQLAKPHAPESLSSFEQALPYQDLSGEAAITLRKIGDYTPSPQNWQDEVLYFLLPDRFSDDKQRDLLKHDPQSIQNARPATGDHPGWWWSDWAKSGKDRFQGGTINGIKSRLDYLKNLGVTTIWIGPIFKQRSGLDTYHGYGVQNFLEVEPRFGTRRDLVDLIDAAHQQGIRIVLDIIFNHSGSNFIYPDGEPNELCPNDKPDPKRQAEYKPFPDYYQTIKWYDQNEQSSGVVNGPQAAVWPVELQNEEFYTRAGTACQLGAGELNNPHDVHKRTDFLELRDINTDNPQALNALIQCYKYWIALTDCDGFRIDTLKHVAKDQARSFCGAIKEYAAKLGKTNFLLIGEIAGGDHAQNVYINALNRNLNAALDIGEMRPTIRRVAKGLDEAAPSEFFAKFKIEDDQDDFPSQRFTGSRHVSILDDHDHVSTEKLRFSYNSPPYQELAGVALQLFTLGIPCIYYGTEQGFRGPEETAIPFLINEGWGSHDCFLREAMFGPEHPLVSGFNGTHREDASLPGFGPFGTAGKECFDAQYQSYQKIAAMIAVRRKYSALRYGRQYHRQISYLEVPFSLRTEPGQIVAWSRILSDDEHVCILNSNGAQKRRARIVVDKKLNNVGSELELILNTTTDSNHPARLKVQEYAGIHFIEINDLEPSGFLIYSNKATID